MMYVPERITIYFFLATIYSFSLLSTQAALKPGRLILLLHETGAAGNESKTKKEIGAVTMRAATAIAQQAGIIVMSPTIWENLLTRITWFSNQITKEGSLPALFTTSWELNTRQPSVQTHAQLRALSTMDPTLLHHLYLFKNYPSADEWLCFTHTTASVVILIPKKYIDDRRGLLPRSLPTTYQPNEYATGIHLSKCNPVTLASTTAQWQRLALQAHHIRKRSTFSLPHFESLFISRNSVHPLLTVPWNVYMVGHGTYKNTCCGLTNEQFSDFLHWCNTQLSIHCFYYQSCYGNSNYLSTLPLTQSSTKKVITQNHDLSFPLITGAVGEAPVHALMPRQGSTTITVDTNIAQFFNALETPDTSWEAVLSPITPIISLPQDIHAMSNTPLLILPHNESPIPIDVNNHKTLTNPATAHIIRAGITVFSSNDELAYVTNPQPFIIRGKRAILLLPKEIARPIEIHPYQRISFHKKQHATLFVAPAFLSLSPGDALHHCAAVTLHSINLKDFLTKSFLQLTKQKSAKIFLFDSLTVDNDLTTHFSSKKLSLWNTLATTARRWIYGEENTLETAHITLQKVIVMVNAERLTCIFLEPCTGNQTRARKVVYYRQQSATKQNDPESLDIQTISLKKHETLYEKYAIFCKNQSQ